MKYFISKLSQIIFNKMTLLIVITHWIFAIFAFYTRVKWNGEIHFTYESWTFSILLLLDLPSIAIAESLSMPLNMLIREYFPINGMLVFIISISFQWFIIGIMANQIYLRRKKNLI